MNSVLNDKVYFNSLQENENNKDWVMGTWNASEGGKYILLEVLKPH